MERSFRKCPSRLEIPDAPVAPIILTPGPSRRLAALADDARPVVDETRPSLLLIDLIQQE
jgi:hypothetical protein